MTPRPAIIACAALALVLARRRPAMRPAAVALATLAAIDGARFLPLPARVDVVAWLCWPGASAALAWKVWRGPVARPLPPLPSFSQSSADDWEEALRAPDGTYAGHEPGCPSAHVPFTLSACACGPAPPWSAEAFRRRLRAVPAWARVALAFGLYAAAIALVPFPWREHPWAWLVATRAPFWCGAGVGVSAWATREERPRARAADGESHSGTFSGAYHLGRLADCPVCERAPAVQASRRVAALLTVSATVDALVLLPSLSAASWAVAYPLAWATWAACAVALVMGTRRH